MSILNTGFSAIGRLAALVLLLGAFLFGMAGVVYMSLQGEEVRVPEITGKNFDESEKELAALGLKIKKRADRFSPEMPNIVIEQLPKTGETVKTGQMILVVTSKGPGEGDQPPTLKNVTEEDDAEKIEEMISDKPKKPKANSNTNRKKADTARDVTSNTSGSNTSGGTPSNKKEPDPNKESTDKPKETPKANTKATPPKPAAGDTRPKPQPRQ